MNATAVQRRVMGTGRSTRRGTMRRMPYGAHVQIRRRLEKQFKEIKRFNTAWIFPSQTSLRDPMSSNRVRLALRRLGLKDRMTAHGFRALARTTIREQLDYAPDVIERSLPTSRRGRWARPTTGPPSLDNAPR